MGGVLAVADCTTLVFRNRAFSNLVIINWNMYISGHHSGGGGTFLLGGGEIPVPPPPPPSLYETLRVNTFKSNIPLPH